MLESSSAAVNLSVYSVLVLSENVGMAVVIQRKSDV
jgi:hypothetical protein